MKITDKKVVFEGRYLRLVEKNIANRRGESFLWETIERKNVHGWGGVVIIALTKDRELILENNLLKNNGVLVVEHEKDLKLNESYDKLRLVRHKIYGVSAISVFSFITRSRQCLDPTTNLSLPGSTG